MVEYDFEMEYTCPICGKELKYNISSRDQLLLGDEEVAVRTYDCHGIPFRMVCVDCYEKIMDEQGFDGEEYDEFDENLDYDY